MRKSIMLLALLSCITAPLTWAQTPAAVATEKAEKLEQQAVENPQASPAPAAQAITPKEAQAVDPTGAAPMDDALTCMARSIYWEAKGGSAQDMADVANVVMNRLGQPDFPDSVCGVVKQGSERKGCQFSWWCDGRPDQAKEDDRYTLAKDIARKALNRQLPDRTHGAQFFHDHSVAPAVFAKMVRTARTDSFVFYRPRDEQAGQ
ncbi:MULTISPECIES: cell wall hydrolase [unclassified Pseudomonas]|uniref:cell wall hydrolase n=1 Tax=unclassified Pseudomonas TaxID=196821 RepID=UPI000BDDA8A3|nr:MULTISPECIES: cell wall hydrolase [unclassified Pseudomonas]PVZ16490.1 cell wall hydrolase [Pseudomonas sp. URIL14HWK12:I12]PVZ25654.1 cell wall hydrolase [Pseudomonas sp. URIL14HWK12:I10]PVZ36822.1 cell wall hydrolase [Pseudomonas sp. URIL14HWK12:I11]SNZ12544.1 Cell Wall Hydrolase [Pseudomonas sp. URIL14HWK12:I9]